MTTLICANNEIQDLEDVADLENLEKIDISSNYLTSFHGIEKLKKLSEFNASDNNLPFIFFDKNCNSGENVIYHLYNSLIEENDMNYKSTLLDFNLLETTIMNICD